MNKLRQRKGFSLIELLVVISIIVVLISITLAALGSARESAEVSVCNNNLSQLIRAQLAYTVDNDGLFPRSSEWAWAHPRLEDGTPFPNNFDPTNIQSVYEGTIYPYYDNVAAHLCPTATKRLPLQDIWVGDAIARNYVMNWNVGPVGHPWDQRNGQPKYLPNSDQEALDSISLPADLLVVGEENSFPIAGFNLFSNGLNDGYFHADPYDVLGSFHKIKGDDLTSGISYAAMADGHVREVNYNGYTKALYDGRRKEYSEMYCTDEIANED